MSFFDFLVVKSVRYGYVRFFTYNSMYVDVKFCMYIFLHPPHIDVATPRTFFSKKIKNCVFLDLYVLYAWKIRGKFDLFYIFIIFQLFATFLVHNSTVA